MSIINIVAPAEPTRAETVSERGFGGYAKFTDSYGAEVKVTQSSNASGDYVWIFIRGGEGNRDYDAEKILCCEQGINWQSGTGPKVYTDAATHLSLEDAKRVRDALTNWITDIEEQPVHQ